MLRIMRLFIEVKEKILFQLQTAIDENHNQVRYLSLVGVLASDLVHRIPLCVSLWHKTKLRVGCKSNWSVFYDRIFTPCHDCKNSQVWVMRENECDMAYHRARRANVVLRAILIMRSSVPAC